MPPMTSIGQEKINEINAAHERVVEAEIVVRAWRAVPGFVNKQAHPEYLAAATEATQAKAAWDSLLLSL